jgi:hypothetical protein
MTCTFKGEFEAIPENIRAGLVNYIEFHIPPGGFLTAMIRGDLFEAVRRADANSLKAITLIAVWLDRNAPEMCGPTNMAGHLSKRNS